MGIDYGQDRFPNCAMKVQRLSKAYHGRKTHEKKRVEYTPSGVEVRSTLFCGNSGKGEDIVSTCMETYRSSFENCRKLTPFCEEIRNQIARKSRSNTAICTRPWPVFWI